MLMPGARRQDPHSGSVPAPRVKRNGLEAAACRRGRVDVVTLHECGRYSVALTRLDNLHALGTVTLQPGPLLGHNYVQDSFLDVGDELLKARAFLIAGTGDVVVFVDLRQLPVSPLTSAWASPR